MLICIFYKLSLTATGQHLRLKICEIASYFRTIKFGSYKH